MENPAPIPSIHPGVPLPKQRHGCLTAFLIAMILGNGYFSISYAISLFNSGAAASSQAWIYLLSITLNLLGVLCAILIFRWRKIGFWSYCALVAVEIIINLVLGAGLISFASLASVAVLYGVLQIGKQNKGWPQLE